MTEKFEKTEDGDRRLKSPYSHPLVVYDGNCAFCRFCVLYGRAKAQKPIRWIPFQHLHPDPDPLLYYIWAQTVHLVETDGAVRTGAQAICRFFYLAHIRLWPWRWYVRSRVFRGLSECFFRWISHHRPLLWKLLRFSHRIRRFFRKSRKTIKP